MRRSASDGLLKEEGLAVEVQLANGSGSAMQQLIAGQVAASVGGGADRAMALINRGAKIITAASFNSRNIYYPVALETSRIKTIADMKGTKIGVVSASSSNIYWIKATAQTAGLDPAADLTLVSVGSGPAALRRSNRDASTSCSCSRRLTTRSSSTASSCGASMISRRSTPWPLPSA
ncbi:MAG: ABC transporter substrate-binding protein [Pseudomonadota bacterium]